MSTPNTLHPLILKACHAFKKRFGAAPTFAAAAPGRVNIIGEHTDYNAGYVLPIALQRYTLIVAAPTQDVHQATLASDTCDEVGQWLVDGTPLEPGAPSWCNYVKGVMAGYMARDIIPAGFDAMVCSDVPIGGGLSSSAALEVATATLIEAMTGRTLDLLGKALLCQKAEHDFALMPCGIMDQFISVMGKKDHAMLLDCRSQQPRHVPFVDQQVSLLVVNSHVQHALTDGEYALRRKQCQQACQMLKVDQLRDMMLDQLHQNEKKLDSMLYRRAMHVVSENQRTLQAADAMAANDWPRLGELMFDSHASLRDDYEVSCDELDILVDIARQLGDEDGLLGSRMTGGGFGGCTVNLVHTDKIAVISQTIDKQYRLQTGITPSIFATRPGQGTHVITLPN